jgi:hypothetical protein
MSVTQSNMFDRMASSAIGVRASANRGNATGLRLSGDRLRADVAAFGLAVGRKVKQLFSRKPQTLALDYGSKVLRFPSPHEFEFALCARVAPPAARVAEWEHLTLFELRRMATDIRKLEHRYAQVMTAALERGRSLGRLFAKLDAKAFSSDHDWRSIISALSESDDARLDAYRQVALAKYMQYLRNRQAVIQHLYTSRTMDAESPVTAVASGSITQYSGDDAAPQNLHETAIFDFTDPNVAAAAGDAMWLLPRGESIGITLAGHVAVDVALANYAFTLETSPLGTALKDLERGIHYDLRRGRNTIGRDRSCDIVVDLNYKEVSRRHLVIDCIDEHTLILIDMSSHGTRVPASRVIGARPTDNSLLADKTTVGAGPTPHI